MKDIFFTNMAYIISHVQNQIPDKVKTMYFAAKQHLQYGQARSMAYIKKSFVEPLADKARRVLTVIHQKMDNGVCVNPKMNMDDSVTIPRHAFLSSASTYAGGHIDNNFDKRTNHTDIVTENHLSSIENDASWIQMITSTLISASNGGDETLKVERTKEYSKNIHAAAAFEYYALYNERSVSFVASTRNAPMPKAATNEYSKTSTNMGLLQVKLPSTMQKTTPLQMKTNNMKIIQVIKKLDVEIASLTETGAIPDVVLTYFNIKRSFRRCTAFMKIVSIMDLRTNQCMVLACLCIQTLGQMVIVKLYSTNNGSTHLSIQAFMWGQRFQDISNKNEFFAVKIPPILYDALCQQKKMSIEYDSDQSIVQVLVPGIMKTYKEPRTIGKGHRIILRTRVSADAERHCTMTQKVAVDTLGTYHGVQFISLVAAVLKTDASLVQVAMNKNKSTSKEMSVTIRIALIQKAVTHEYSKTNTNMGLLQVKLPSTMQDKSPPQMKTNNMKIIQVRKKLDVEITSLTETGAIPDVVLTYVHIERSFGRCTAFMKIVSIVDLRTNQWMVLTCLCIQTLYQMVIVKYYRVNHGSTHLNIQTFVWGQRFQDISNKNEFFAVKVPSIFRNDALCQQKKMSIEYDICMLSEWLQKTIRKGHRIIPRTSVPADFERHCTMTQMVAVANLGTNGALQFVRLVAAIFEIFASFVQRAENQIGSEYNNKEFAVAPLTKTVKMKVSWEQVATNVYSKNMGLLQTYVPSDVHISATPGENSTLRQMPTDIIGTIDNIPSTLQKQVVLKQKTIKMAPNQGREKLDVHIESTLGKCKPFRQMAAVTETRTAQNVTVANLQVEISDRRNTALLKMAFMVDHTNKKWMVLSCQYFETTIHKNAILVPYMAVKYFSHCQGKEKSNIFALPWKRMARQETRSVDSIRRFDLTVFKQHSGVFAVYQNKKLVDLNGVPPFVRCLQMTTEYNDRTTRWNRRLGIPDIPFSRQHMNQAKMRNNLDLKTCDDRKVVGTLPIGRQQILANSEFKTKVEKRQGQLHVQIAALHLVRNKCKFKKGHGKKFLCVAARVLMQTSWEEGPPLQLLQDKFKLHYSQGTMQTKLPMALWELIQDKYKLRKVHGKILHCVVARVLMQTGQEDVCSQKLSHGTIVTPVVIRELIKDNQNFRTCHEMESPFVAAMRISRLPLITQFDVRVAPMQSVHAKCIQRSKHGTSSRLPVAACELIQDKQKLQINYGTGPLGDAASDLMRTSQEERPNPSMKRHVAPLQKVQPKCLPGSSHRVLVAACELKPTKEKVRNCIGMILHDVALEVLNEKRDGELVVRNHHGTKLKCRLASLDFSFSNKPLDIHLTGWKQRLANFVLMIIHSKLWVLLRGAFTVFDKQFNDMVTCLAMVVLYKWLFLKFFFPVKLLDAKEKYWEINLESGWKQKEVTLGTDNPLRLEEICGDAAGSFEEDVTWYDFQSRETKGKSTDDEKKCDVHLEKPYHFPFGKYTRNKCNKNYIDDEMVATVKENCDIKAMINLKNGDHLTPSSPMTRCCVVWDHGDTSHDKPENCIYVCAEPAGDGHNDVNIDVHSGNGDIDHHDDNNDDNNDNVNIDISGGGGDDGDDDDDDEEEEGEDNEFEEGEDESPNTELGEIHVSQCDCDVDENENEHRNEDRVEDRNEDGNGENVGEDANNAEDPPTDLHIDHISQWDHDVEENEIRAVNSNELALAMLMYHQVTLIAELDPNDAVQNHVYYVFLDGLRRYPRNSRNS